MIFARVLLCLFVSALAACTQFPELEGTISPEAADAAYPELLPLEPILAQANGSSIDPTAEQGAIQGRVASLRARADRLRGSVLTGQEKRRLEQGLR